MGKVLVAIEAVPAVGIPRADDVVAGLDQRDGLTDSLDDSRGFVSQHDREREAQRAVNDFKIGVAESAGVVADQDIVALEARHLDIVDLERGFDFAEYSRFEVHWDGSEIVKT